ncbi:hypothetical protein ACET3Z_012350 [Daucus carota]
MAFIEHRHPLILNEKYYGAEGDVCYICKDALHSRLMHSIYRCCNSNISDSSSSGDDIKPFFSSQMVKKSLGNTEFCVRITENEIDCSKLFIHRSCAELALTISNYHMHPHHTIFLKSEMRASCNICSQGLTGLLGYTCRECWYYFCVKCVTSPRVHHPGHNQHELTLVQHPASFRCYACQDDLYPPSSSCQCTICPFWIHLKCAQLPSLLKYKFHRHPLLLSYSLPQQYLRFRHYCSICHATLSPTQWLYHCANCRFLAHISCATSTTKTSQRLSSSDDEYKNLVHLPMPDETSVNLLRQLFIEKMISNHNASNDTDSSFASSSSIKGAARENVLINHWSHEHHTLVMINKHDAADDHLIVRDNNGDNSIVCDGCTKPIYATEVSYACHLCKYFLHRYCAKMPKQLQSTRYQDGLMLPDISSYFFFICNGCKFPSSGMRMMTEKGDFQLDIGCASLPRSIKHEAHHHPLTQHESGLNKECTACLRDIDDYEIVFGCDKCRFYLHGRCALKPYKIIHRWDRDHPLSLNLNLDNIEDHPHDFNCEYCSEDIDPSAWFYHCRYCDISFHIHCIDLFYRYSHIKFGISVDIDHQLHEHSLTVVLNERKRCCGICHRQLSDENDSR